MLVQHLLKLLVHPGEDAFLDRPTGEPDHVELTVDLGRAGLKVLSFYFCSDRGSRHRNLFFRILMPPKQILLLFIQLFQASVLDDALETALTATIRFLKR